MMQRKLVEIATNWIPVVDLTFWGNMSKEYYTLTTNNTAVTDLDYTVPRYASFARDVKQISGGR
jgi:hypothetical protein